MHRSHANSTSSPHTITKLTKLMTDVIVTRLKFLWSSARRAFFPKYYILASGKCYGNHNLQLIGLQPTYQDARRVSPVILQLQVQHITCRLVDDRGVCRRIFIIYEHNSLGSPGWGMRYSGNYLLLHIVCLSRALRLRARKGTASATWVKLQTICYHFECAFPILVYGRVCNVAIKLIIRIENQGWRTHQVNVEGLQNIWQFGTVSFDAVQNKTNKM